MAESQAGEDHGAGICPVPQYRNIQSRTALAVVGLHGETKCPPGISLGVQCIPAPSHSVNPRLLGGAFSVDGVAGHGAGRWLLSHGAACEMPMTHFMEMKRLVENLFSPLSWAWVRGIPQMVGAQRSHLP